MISFSLNLDGLLGTAQTSHEKKVRELVGTHFGFPGSDKLKVDVTIKDNGSSEVSFAGPRDVISEAKRLWQENVEPAERKFKSKVSSASSQVQASVSSATPKRKKVRAKVKASTAKKKKR